MPPTTQAATAPTIQPRLRARRSAATPGSSRASRAIADAMPTKPAASRNMRTKSTTRSPWFMASVDWGNVGTGIESVPVPRSPSTVTRTCQAPAVIIHRWPVNERGSPGDRAARSATGANCAPGPLSGSGTMCTSRTSSAVVRMPTSATPGIAYGGRTVTNRRYGPARPSRKTSGLPTCAATLGCSARAATNAARAIQDRRRLALEAAEGLTASPCASFSRRARPPTSSGTQRGRR